MKVGDRVRVNCPECWRHEREGTIWSVAEDGCWTNLARSLGKHGTAYRVDLDGIGRTSDQGNYVGYMRSQLIPLTKPKEVGTWEETFKGTDFDIRREREHT